MTTLNPSSGGFVPSHVYSGGGRRVTVLPAAVSAFTRSVMPGVEASDNIKTLPVIRRIWPTFVTPPSTAGTREETPESDFPAESKKVARQEMSPKTVGTFVMENAPPAPD